MVKVISENREIEVICRSLGRACLTAPPRARPVLSMRTARLDKTTPMGSPVSMKIALSIQHAAIFRSKALAKHDRVRRRGFRPLIQKMCNERADAI